MVDSPDDTGDGPDGDTGRLTGVDGRDVGESQLDRADESKEVSDRSREVADESRDGTDEPTGTTGADGRSSGHTDGRIPLTTRELLGGSAAAVGGLAGCLGGEDRPPGTPTVTPTGVPPGTTTATPASTPAAGDQTVRDNWTHVSELRSPLLDDPPSIDGQVEDHEWANAARLPPLIVWERWRMDEERTDAFVGHTEDAIYVGWRVYRDSDVPMALENTEPGYVEGSDVWGDDAVELFFDVEHDGESAITFVGNAAGAYGDGLLTGATDFAPHWDWEYNTRQTDFGWEGEVRIAFDELGVDGPPAEDETWGFNFWRNNKTPENIVADWNPAGTHNARANGVLRFGDDTPAYRVVEGGPIGDDRLGTVVDLVNGSDDAQNVVVDYGVYRRHDDVVAIDFIDEVQTNLQEEDREVAAFVDASEQISSLLDAFYDTLVQERREVTIAPDERTTVDLVADGVSSGDFVVLYHVRMADGRLIAAGTLPIRMWEPVEVAVTPYYLATEEMDVEVSLHRSHLIEQVTDVELALEQGDRTLDTFAGSIETVGEGIALSTADIDPGDYTVRVEALDADGDAVTTVEQAEERPEPPFWVEEEHGTGSFVPQPWTEVDAGEDAVEVLNRSYAFEDDVLPAQMESKGEPLFAAAPRLVLEVDGEEHRVGGSPELVETDPEYADYRWTGSAGPVTVDATVRVEFDGFSTIDLEMTADGATVEGLYVEFPIDESHIDLYALGPFFNERRGTTIDHLTGDLDRYGSIPDDGFEIGFNHSIWIGTPERGLYWCAERAEHWHNETREHMIELTRDGERATFRLRVIDTPTEVDEFRYRWGLLATPARPGPRSEFDQDYYAQDGYPGDILQDEDARDEVEEEWIPTYHDVGADWVNIFGHWNEDYGWGQPIRRKEGVEDRAALSDVLNEAGLNVTWFTGWVGMTSNVEEYPYYGEAMRHVPPRFSHGGYKECTYSGFEHKEDPFTQYFSNGVAWLHENIGADGIYTDGTHVAKPCYNPYHGCGYEDPETGERIVSREIWGKRELYKRLYKIFHGELVEDGLVYSHGNFEPAVTSFVDIRHNGEHAGWDEYGDPETYRAVFNPTQHGIPVEHAWQHGKPVPRSFAWGVTLVHDNRLKMYHQFLKQSHLQAESYEPEEGIDWRMWVPDQWFDWSVEHEWHPYYDNDDVVTVSDDAVLASFHHNEADQLTFFAVNMDDSATDVSISLDTDGLDLPGALYARDVVTGDTFEIDGGTFDLDFFGHRPRVLLIHSDPIPRVGPDGGE